MARLTPEEEKGLKEAYAKVYENLQEGRLKDNPQVQALRTSAKPFMNQGKVEVSNLNKTGTTQKIGGAGGSTGGSVGSAGGQAGGGQAAAKKPGLLGRLGSLAGKAVSGARNVAGNVAGAARNVAGNVASGIKAGAKAVGGALANKGPVQGSRSRFNNRGGSAAGAAGAAPTGGAAKAAPAAAPKPTLSNNSPAAKAGIPLAQRQQAADKHAQFKADRASGKLKADRIAKERSRVTSVMDMESYDPIFDETVHFLVSEGHVKDESEAISIMSEPEFIESFNEELYG